MRDRTPATPETVLRQVTEDIVKRGVDAIQLVKLFAREIGGGGGGKPTLAQAGGKDKDKLPHAISLTDEFVRSNLKETSQ